MVARGVQPASDAIRERGEVVADHQAAAAAWCSAHEADFHSLVGAVEPVCKLNMRIGAHTRCGACGQGLCSPRMTETKWRNLFNMPEPESAASPSISAEINELARIAAACPHGWIELAVEQGRTASTQDSPPEGYQDVHAICIWGVGPDIAEAIDDLIEDAIADGSPLSKVPAGSFVAIARVVRREVDNPSGCPCCSVYLDLGWGIGGAAVYGV